MPDFDAVIVGASLAGCAAAVHLGRAGARVALVERRPDPDAYKRVCGHFIQASAIPALERLGVLGELEAAGGVRGHARVWTRYGWISGPAARGRLAERPSPGARPAAAPDAPPTTPGVELLLGHALEALEPGRVELRHRGGTRALTARLVIGADGRGSRTAKLAGLRTRTRPNARFGYWGYFDGPPLGTGASVHLWMLEPDVAIATPTDGGQMLYVAFPVLERAPGVQARHRGRPARASSAGSRTRRRSPSPRLAGPLVGKLDLTNEWRPATGRSLALVGDAALAADPVGAIGCGWAVQSAEWLAEEVGPALAGEPLPHRARSPATSGATAASCSGTR